MKELFKVIIDIENPILNEKQAKVAIYVWAKDRISAYSKAKERLFENNVISNNSKIVGFNTIKTTLDKM